MAARRNLELKSDLSYISQVIRSFADKRPAALWEDRIPKGFKGDLGLMMTIRMNELAGTDFSDVAGSERIGPVTPGEVLLEEFMVPLGLSGRALAADLGVPSNRVTEIVSAGHAISAQTAILLGQRFGTSAEFWLNLQMARDLEQARRHPRRAA